MVEYSGTLAGSLCFVASGSWHALFCVELSHVCTKWEGTHSTREPGKSYRLLRQEVRHTGAQTNVKASCVVLQSCCVCMRQP